MRASSAFAFLLGSLSFASGLSAQQMPAPVGVQIPILLKVLAFDRHLTDVKEKELVLGVLFQSGFRTSVGVKDAVMEIVARDGSDRLASRRLKPIAVDADEKGTLESKLKQSGADVLYVTPLRALDVASVASVARTLGVLTLSGVPDYIRSGLSIGLDVKRDRPEILVNLKAAREAGADLAAPLLKMATIVESRKPAP